MSSGFNFVKLVVGYSTKVQITTNRCNFNILLGF